MAEQSEQLIDHLACQIRRWRLTWPAIALLEITRPLSFIIGQGLLLCQPLLEPLSTGLRFAGYAELLADRSNVDRLLARLEQDYDKEREA